MKKTYLDMMDRFSSLRVAVVGDLMLDRYIWGSATRISQEAPVPVVHVKNETWRLGGAANVAANVTSLGAKATVFGTMGQGRHAETLTRELHAAGIATSGVEQLPGDHLTTVKTRVIAGGQQIVRIDREDPDAVDDAVRRRIADSVADAVRAGNFDGVILEDYAKGLLTASCMQRIVDACNAGGILVALDPHPIHVTPVTGMTLMTPNRMEAFALAGVYHHPAAPTLDADSHLLHVGETLLGKWQVENLLITLGGDGMALFRKGLPPLHIPTRAREVFDVSGAGDTVTASFVLAMLAGATPPQAAGFSNYAAGIVVAKTGTVPVNAGELRAELELDDA